MITGAGILCNAGIPDFRSENGLYNMVKHKYPKQIVRGQDLFDINLFRDETSLEIFVLLWNDYTIIAYWLNQLSLINFKAFKG